MPLNRRQYLLGTLGASSAVLWSAWRSASSPSVPEPLATPLAHPGPANPPAGPLTTTRRESYGLGSKLAFTVLHAPDLDAERALDAALAEIELVEQVMSLYRPTSQLSRLNRTGTLLRPHPYLLEVLDTAAAMHAASDGAFDVTIQPLWDVFARCAREQRAPRDQELAAARRLVDWRQVDVSAERLTLRQPGAALTLNGIAQGFAVDRALAALRGAGIEHALLDTGELGALGGRDGETPWTIGIQHPRRDDAYLSLAELQNRCLATSGDYATRFDDVAHHIFDPRTGRSPGELTSVSVAAPTGLLADALSTALFVLGRDAGLKLVAEWPACDALVATRTGSVASTPGFPLSA